MTKKYINKTKNDEYYIIIKIYWRFISVKCIRLMTKEIEKIIKYAILDIGEREKHI